MTTPTRRRAPQPADHGIDLDGVAWQFLRSEYATESYLQWSLDRRLHTYLNRRGLTDIANSGTAYATLFDRVMHTIGIAIRRGVLSAPHPG